MAEEEEKKNNLLHQTSKLEKQIEFLIKDSQQLLLSRLRELGVEGNTPNDLLVIAHKIVEGHKTLQTRVREEQLAVETLESEQLALLSALKNVEDDRGKKEETGITIRERKDSRKESNQTRSDFIDAAYRDRADKSSIPAIGGELDRHRAIADDAAAVSHCDHVSSNLANSAPSKSFPVSPVSAAEKSPRSWTDDVDLKVPTTSSTAGVEAKPSLLVVDAVEVKSEESAAADKIMAGGRRLQAYALGKLRRVL